MGRRPRGGRRTPSQTASDRRARDLSVRLGRGLREGRSGRGERQADVAERAGIARSTWSAVERGEDARVTLETLCRCAMAVDSDLHTYLERLPGAERPRDHVHLRHQELVIATAHRGGWEAVPESPVGHAGRTSWIDVLLRRRTGGREDPGGREEWAVIEIWDWFDDVGAAFRAWDRRLADLEQLALARGVADRGRPTHVNGAMVIRATKRNRDLLRDHANVFRTRFPGSSTAWLRALVEADAPMPDRSALLWVSVDGSRLSSVRL